MKFLLKKILSIILFICCTTNSIDLTKQIHNLDMSHIKSDIILDKL